VGLEAPLALLGALAVGIPILAHLVRRRDLPKIALPTIALLRRAQAHSRRRTRLVDVLLLVCRIVLVAIAALALAGPYATVRLAFGDGRVAAVAIVLDDSMSMSRTIRGATLCESAVARARSVAGSLPRGSEITVVLAGKPPRVLVPRTTDLEAAQARLRSIACPSARGTDLGGAVTRALQQLSNARNEPRRLLVLSDMAKHAQPSPIAWPGREIELSVQRLGEDAPELNRFVASATAVPDPATPLHASVVVEVRAHGVREGRALAPVVVRRGATELARTEVELSSGSGRASLHVPLPRDGDPTASAELEGTGDAIALDDRRGLLLRSASAVRVLLVDGDPHPSREDDEVRFVSRALELATGADGSAFTVQTTDPDTFATRDLVGVDVIVLANVPVPASSVAARLRAFVDDGGGLLVASGDHVDPRAYAAVLGDLLPARPRAAAAVEPPLTLRAVALGDLLPAGPTGLSGVRTRKRLLVETPDSAASVPLTYEDGSPALIVRGHGDGHVALLTTTVDDDWTDLPFRPGFLPLLARLCERLASPSIVPDRAYEPGSVVHIPAPAGATRVEVITPRGDRHAFDGRALTRAIAFRKTDAPGAYRVRVATRSSGARDIPRAAFVVAPPASESDLAPGPMPREMARARDRATARGVVKRPLAPYLFLVVGLLAIMEGLLRMAGALRISRGGATRAA